MQESEGRPSQSECTSSQSLPTTEEESCSVVGSILCPPLTHFEGALKLLDDRAHPSPCQRSAAEDLAGVVADQRGHTGLPAVQRQGEPFMRRKQRNAEMQYVENGSREQRTVAKRKAEKCSIRLRTHLYLSSEIGPAKSVLSCFSLIIDI